MNHWASDGGFGLHVFHKNNELAGYCSVLHALALTGSTGDYGRRLSAVVIGFGATARGAVTALNAHGIHDVQVLTNRGVAAVGSPIHSVRIAQFDHDDEAPFLSEVITERGRVPLAPFLAESDIVVNCTLQDPNAPLTYLRTEDLDAFRPGSLIVDVSCDEGMGFSWAKTTTFAEPMFKVGDHIDYYAVDHSPSYLWNSSSWEISEALLPFLETVITGPEAWTANETIRRAIEIRDGVVLNPDVLQFQQRGAGVPAPAADGLASGFRDESDSRCVDPRSGCPNSARKLGAPAGLVPDNPQQPAPVLQVHLEHQLVPAGQHDGDRRRGQRRHPAGDQDGRVRIHVLGQPADHRPADGLPADQHHDVQAHDAAADGHVGADLDQLVGRGQEHQAPEPGQHHGRPEPHHGRRQRGQAQHQPVHSGAQHHRAQPQFAAAGRR